MQQQEIHKFLRSLFYANHCEIIEHDPGLFDRSTNN